MSTWKVHINGYVCIQISDMLSLSSALPYVNLVNDKTVKRTGVFPLKLFNNRDLMENQNAAISVFVFKANNCLSKTIEFAEVTYIHTYPVQIRCHTHMQRHKYTQTKEESALLWVSVQLSALREAEQGYSTVNCCSVLFLSLCAYVCMCVWEGTLDTINIVHHCSLIAPHLIFTFKWIGKHQTPILKRNSTSKEMQFNHQILVTIMIKRFNKDAVGWSMMLVTAHWNLRVCLHLLLNILNTYQWYDGIIFILIKNCENN